MVIGLAHGRRFWVATPLTSATRVERHSRTLQLVPSLTEAAAQEDEAKKQRSKKGIPELDLDLLLGYLPVKQEWASCGTRKEANSRPSRKPHQALVASWTAA